LVFVCLNGGVGISTACAINQGCVDERAASVSLRYHNDLHRVHWDLGHDGPARHLELREHVERASQRQKLTTLDAPVPAV
jgi:hypothetical protein